MPSSNNKLSEPTGLNLLFFTIPQEILLQIGTGSVLLALLGGKAAAQTLQTLGQASEEVFRGDRLPVLQFPTEIESESS
ncbi:MAG: hypothetical protein JO235_04450 [Chroococcidiopsidaceae cyanobacterium CP_BM_RX_35]|nr:hypothetical protein [Chroococcidiopsidaceae cyanobacterium CP_BM_RX_35]